MKRAAIDIGSNTVQMLAGEIIEGRVKIAGQYLITTRLGESERKNYLSEKSILDTVNALKDIKRMLSRDGITEIRAVATSAVRDAINNEDLIQKSLEGPGIAIRVLTGKEEAYLSYLGASTLFPDQEVTVLDIGGGSTEIIRKYGENFDAKSINLGAVRAYSNSWNQADIISILESAGLPGDDGHPLVAVGGTATTAVALKKHVKDYRRQLIDGEIITRKDIIDLLDILVPMSRDQRCLYSPVLIKRGQVIVEGLWILKAVMEMMSHQSITVSDAGILDGILLDWYSEKH